MRQAEHQGPMAGATRQLLHRVGLGRAVLDPAEPVALLAPFLDFERERFSLGYRRLIRRALDRGR